MPCIAQLELPIAHRRVARTTNLLERLFGEERRRTKVIAPAFGERARCSSSCTRR
jgi:transposase-like protein